MLNMKKICIIALSVFFTTMLVHTSANAQISPLQTPALGVTNPWTNSQLMEPAALAAILKVAGSNNPLIFNIGAVEDIKGARHIGAVSKAENLQKFKNALTALPRNTFIVIYCGCCPFAKCPNIRPAFSELKKMGFTNLKVLNLSTNLKTDWIAKEYPLAGG